MVRNRSALFIEIIKINLQKIVKTLVIYNGLYLYD